MAVFIFDAIVWLVPHLSISKGVKVITLTPLALAKIKEELAKHAGAVGLRLQVEGGGCSGFQYRMLLEKIGHQPDDQVVEQDDLKVFIDPRSAPYLQGVTIDYEDSSFGKGYKFTNPNASSTCGCGESFNV